MSPLQVDLDTIKKDIKRDVAAIKTLIEELNQRLEAFITNYYPVDIQVGMEYMPGAFGIIPKLDVTIIQRTKLL